MNVLTSTGRNAAAFSRKQPQILKSVRSFKNCPFHHLLNTCSLFCAIKKSNINLLLNCNV